MAQERPPRPRPIYLHGLTFKNVEDHPKHRIRSAFYVYEYGKLSTRPCDECIANNADCIVAKKRASRCMRCVKLDSKAHGTKECQAGGVNLSFERSKNFSPPSTPLQTVGSMPQSTGGNTSNSSLPVRAAGATAQPVPAATQPATQVTPRSAVTVPVNLTTGQVANPQSNINLSPPTKRNRKGQVVKPQVAPQSAVAVPLNLTTDGVATPQNNPNHRAPTKRKRKNRASSPLNATKPVAKHARKSIPVKAIEYPYASTASNATGHVTMQDASIPSNLPAEGVERNLSLRSKDRAAWVQWAKDLHQEYYSPHRTQDLSPHTMYIIGIMAADGVWPTGNVIDLSEE